MPGAVVPPLAETPQQQDVVFDEPEPRSPSESSTDGGNAPVAEHEPTTDLDAVRDELQRRSADPGN